MKSYAFSFAMLSTMFFQNYAHAIAFDVSGRDGRRAQSTSNEAENGENAGSIDLEVGFVPGSNNRQVFFRGTLVKPGRNAAVEEVNQIVETLTLNRIQIRANGGDGGDGAPGRTGRDGERGRDGSSGSSFYGSTDGSDGQDGQDGQDGGPGGPAGSGGNAGIVKIKLAPDSELLTSVIQIEANPGRLGEGGSGGRGGSGGSGGSGGMFGCQTRTNAAGENSLVCGNSGSRGRSGNSGRSGQKGSNGRNGLGAQIQYIDSANQAVSGSFAIDITGFDVKEKFEDSVYEPGEEIEILGMTVRNSGRREIPAANYSVGFGAGDRSSTTANRSVAPGGVLQIRFEQPIKMTLGRAHDWQLTLRLNFLQVNFRLPPRLMVQYPIQIQNLSVAPFTQSARQSVIQIPVSNISVANYGVAIRRQITLTIHPPNNLTALEIKNAEGNFVPFNSAQRYVIDSIAARASVTKSIEIKLVQNIPLGTTLPFDVRLGLDQSKVNFIAETRGAANLTLDPNAVIDFYQNVRDLWIRCKFHQRYTLTDRTVGQVWIKKSATDQQIKIKYRLRNAFSDSPEYSLPVNQFNLVLNKIFSRQNLDQVELINVMQAVSRESDVRRAQDTYIWQFNGCYNSNN